MKQDREHLGRMSMHVDVYDAEPPKHPAKRGPDNAFMFVMMALVVVLVSMALAVIVAQLVMSAEGL